MNLLLLMTVLALLIGGMGVAMLGSVKVTLAKRLGIDETRVGGLVSLFGFTLIPTFLTAGFLTDALGPYKVIVAGSVVLAGSLLVLAGARNYMTALAAVILLSTGWALLINVTNVLTPPVFNPDHPAAAFNLANVFFGLGAFVTPLLIGFLLRQTSFVMAIALVGIFWLLPGVLANGAEFPTVHPGGKDLISLLQNPVMWLCGFALFFYGPLEASMGAWATTYLTEQGVGEKTATGLLSGFWLSFLMARFTTFFVLPKGWETALVLALAVACTGVWTVTVLGRNRATAMSAVILAGLIFGPIFPTLLAILLGQQVYPIGQDLHGRAVGMFFAIGGIGWTIIPMLIGAYSQRTSLRRGFSVAIASAVGLSVIALWLFLFLRIRTS